MFFKVNIHNLVLDILGWWKNNCGFALLNFVIWYRNTILNKCGYVIHNFIVHFLLYVFSSKWFSSVQSFSRVRLLRPHELQHARLPRPSPTPGVHSNSRPSSRWCHPAVSSSAVTFSSCPQSLPASESFPMSQLFTWGGQSTGASTLTSFLPKNTQDWSPLEWTGWISLQSKRLSRVFSNTTVHYLLFILYVC